MLGSFDASLREYAARKLMRQGVNLRKGVVKHMDDTTITLQVGPHSSLSYTHTYTHEDEWYERGCTLFYSPPTCSSRPSSLLFFP